MPALKCLSQPAVRKQHLKIHRTMPDIRRRAPGSSQLAQRCWTSQNVCSLFKLRVPGHTRQGPLMLLAAGLMQFHARRGARRVEAWTPVSGHYWGGIPNRTGLHTNKQTLPPAQYIADPTNMPPYPASAALMASLMVDCTWLAVTAGLPCVEGTVVTGAAGDAGVPGAVHADQVSL